MDLNCGFFTYQFSCCHWHSFSIHNHNLFFCCFAASFSNITTFGLHNFLLLLASFKYIFFLPSMGHRKAEAKTWKVFIHWQHQKCLLFFLLECCVAQIWTIQTATLPQVSTIQTANLLHVQIESEGESYSVMSNSLKHHGLYSPWYSPRQNTGAGSLSLPRRSSQPRNRNQVSHIVGGFFTSWATRKAQ